jgi:hypothetical protein
LPVTELYNWFREEYGSTKWLNIRSGFHREYYENLTPRQRKLTEGELAREEEETSDKKCFELVACTAAKVAGKLLLGPVNEKNTTVSDRVGRD